MTAAPSFQRSEQRYAGVGCPLHLDECRGVGEPSAYVGRSGGEEAAEEAVRAFLGDADPDAWWEQVQTNLRARKIRLLFVADVVPPSLQRIVECLNEAMDPPQVKERRALHDRQTG